jgi:transcriptional regulator with XRE-family HTH domain
MAEADTLTSLSPRELGRHLREVRRRKGLSLSEVARGAGLTRRELNAYEKGRVQIPESDLFVIAGSCGVEVSELRAPQSIPELEAAPAGTNGASASTVPAQAPPMPSSIEDTVAQLRRSQDVAAPSVPAVSGRRRPRALGAGEAPPPPAAPEPNESDWAIERIDPLEAVQWPTDASVHAPAAYSEPSPAEPIDVFEELARLADPAPAPPSDFFTPPPEGSVEELDAAPIDAVDDDFPVFDDLTEPEPVLVEMPAVDAPDEVLSAADAPPIDVAARMESFTSPWDTLRGDEAATGWPDASAAYSVEEDSEWSEADADAWDAPIDDPATAIWDAPAWDPAGSHRADDVTAYEETGYETIAYDATAYESVAWEVPADAGPIAADTTATFDPRFASPEPWPAADATTEPSIDAGALAPWVHEPDPEATSTGFYVDWGNPDDVGASAPDPAFAETEPWADLSAARVPAATAGTIEAEVIEPAEAIEAIDTAEPVAADDDVELPTAWAPFVAADDPFGTDTLEHDPFDTDTLENDPFDTGTFATDPFDTETPTFEPGPDGLDAGDTPAVASDDDEAEPAPPAPDVEDELPVISWRPERDQAPLAPAGYDTAVAAEQLAAVALALDEPVTFAFEPVPEPPPEPELTPDERFVVAGAEWELGNAVPLVEVRSTGSLVMRRADERWALADVRAPEHFALEAYVDLRSGPGFGVLFRADVDDDGRMSGYSFDIDPVYEGGGYLVREWRADRELWNPIAHAPASDPEAMHGLLAVRVTVDDDCLVAAVNGTPVLTVDNLKEASAERGREGASGNRVGIQAWSSTDLVIDELRVAEH